MLQNVRNTVRKNCWEIKNCGRQEGGKNAKELGICPAYSEARLDGVHGGKNAGRACWIVAGTLCGRKVQGTYAAQLSSCIACDFYQLVKIEESAAFMHAGILSRLLDGNKRRSSANADGQRN